MIVQTTQAVSLFDTYCLVIPKGLACSQDGKAGSRVAFITDPEETFVISFEEGMEMMDMIPEREGGYSVCFHRRQNDKYIHERRQLENKTVCSFFHFELKDPSGKVYCLPGQMVVHGDHVWANGVEPLLMELLDAVSLNPCA